MAQEFASDNSQNGLFSRLKLSNHRGFFSFLFVTLSIIFILITFAAVQQQQTTQSKASPVNLCANFNCSQFAPGKFGYTSTLFASCTKNPCCKTGNAEDIGKFQCINKTSFSLTCSSINTYLSGSYKQTWCNNFHDYCKWENNTCVDKRTINSIPTCKGDGDLCREQGDCCTGQSLTCGNEGGGSIKYCRKSNTQPPAASSSSTTITTLAERCRSYGLGANGEVNCYAKAAQATPSDSCMWEPTTGSTTAGNCKPKTSGNSTITSIGVFQKPSCTVKDGQCQKSLDGETELQVGSICEIGGFGQGKSGKYERGLCDGGAETRCCVPNDMTKSTDVGGDYGGVGDPIILPPTGGTGNVELNLKLSYQGIISLPKTKTQLNMKVKLVDAAKNEKVKDSNVFTADANGIWSGKVTFENVDLSQKYYLLIKGPKHVQKKICDANATDPSPGYYSCQFGNITLTNGSNNFNFSNVKMLVGDLDQNSIVNREDTGPLLSALLLDLDQRKSSAILEKFDLNLDGIVEPKDWGLMLEALKIKYDEK